METPAPEHLLYWAMAYKISELLFVADEDGCLSALEQGASAEELAHLTGWREDSTQIILTTLHRAGLVEGADGRYRLAPGMDRLRSLVTIERRLNDWHHAHDSLRQALRSEVGDPLDSLTDPEFMVSFARAMSATARETALRIRKIVRPTGSTRFVDLGGADGSVALALAEGLQDARFTVIDRPALAYAFEKRVTPTEYARRIVFKAGDLRDPAVVCAAVQDADVVTLLNVAHLLHDRCLDGLLCTLRTAAKPGAILVVRELFAVAEGPFGVADIMLLDWLRCGTRFRDNAEQFLARLVRAGFATPQVRRFPGSLDSFVTAHA